MPRGAAMRSIFGLITLPCKGSDQLGDPTRVGDFGINFDGSGAESLVEFVQHRLNELGRIVGVGQIDWIEKVSPVPRRPECGLRESEFFG